MSNACCAPTISPYSTGDSDTASRRSTKYRASATGASVSRLPWIAKNGGAAGCTRSIGDALVDGIIQVKNEYDGSFRRINAMMEASKGEEISMQQALAIQYELMQVGLSQELTAKMADKTSSGVQTLFRNQG